MGKKVSSMMAVALFGVIGLVGFGSATHASAAGCGDTCVNTVEASPGDEEPGEGPVEDCCGGFNWKLQSEIGAPPPIEM